ncbi:hypothetical protein Tco_0944460, partial [Tanacetum coccineum]
FLKDMGFVIGCLIECVVGALICTLPCRCLQESNGGEMYRIWVFEHQSGTVLALLRSDVDELSVPFP